MPVRSLLAALAAAIVLGVPGSAFAMDDSDRASSSAPTLLHLCGKQAAIDEAGCKAQPYDALAVRMDEALQAALAKAPVRCSSVTRPGSTRWSSTSRSPRMARISPRRCSRC